VVSGYNITQLDGLQRWIVNLYSFTGKAVCHCFVCIQCYSISCR